MRGHCFLRDNVLNAKFRNFRQRRTNFVVNRLVNLLKICVPSLSGSIARSLLCQWGGDYSSQSREDYFDEGKSLQPLIPLLLKLPCVIECLCRYPYRRGTVWFETTVSRWGFAQMCPVTRLCTAKTESLGGNAVRKLPSSVIRQLSFPASRLQPEPQLASDFRGGRPRPGGHNRKLPLWSTRKSYV